MLRSDVFSPTSPRVWAARGMARPGLGCPDNRVTGDQGGTLRCAIYVDGGRISRAFCAASSVKTPARRCGLRSGVRRRVRRQLSTNLRTRSSFDRACCECRFVPFLFIVLSLFFFVPFVFIVPFVLIVLVPLGSAAHSTLADIAPTAPARPASRGFSRG